MMRTVKVVFAVVALAALASWTAPTAQAWCDPIELACGDTVSGTSQSGHDDVASYNCLPDTNYNGKADVYRVYASNDSMLILLDWDAPNADRLRMFILYDCNQSHCIATDAQFLALDVNIGEDYWIIVDSKRDNNFPYTLTVICDDHPLPVELTSFDAVPSAEGVNLTWTVASEVNNSHFEIAREQPDVTPWEMIGTVEGRGTAPSAHTYTFIDRATEAGTAYIYRLFAVDNGGFREVIGHATVNAENLPDESAVVTGFELQGNFPNPFNPSTTIKFDVAEAMQLTLDVYDVTGRLMSTLASGTFEAGSHEVTFDAAAYPSGVYFARLASEQESQMVKMMLMK